MYSPSIIFLRFMKDFKFTWKKKNYQFCKLSLFEPNCIMSSAWNSM